MVRYYLGSGFSSDVQSTEEAGSKFTWIAVEFPAEDDEGAHERPEDEA